MRITIMPILFMAFAIIFMTMPADNPVLAQEPPDVINLDDQYCAPSEKALKLCFNVDLGEDIEGDVDYVVQIEPGPKYSPPEGEEVISDPGTIDFDWPIVDKGAGTVTFTYRAFVPTGTDCTKVDTWNYFVQKQSASIADKLLMTDPPGAQLLLPGATVTKCRDFVAEEGYNLLKINPSLNCSPGNFVIFSFTYTDDVLLGFGNKSVVTTKSGCSPFPFTEILGPSTETIPFHAEQKHTFPMGGSVDVVFNPNSSGGEDLVERVTINGDPKEPEGRAWICTPVIDGKDYNWDYVQTIHIEGLGAIQMFCVEPQEAGLQNQGCVVDANPRTYLFGGDVYTSR